MDKAKWPTLILPGEEEAVEVLTQEADLVISQLTSTEREEKSPEIKASEKDIMANISIMNKDETVEVLVSQGTSAEGGGNSLENKASEEDIMDSISIMSKDSDLDEMT